MTEKKKKTTKAKTAISKKKQRSPAVKSGGEQESKWHEFLKKHTVDSKKEGK